MAVAIGRRNAIPIIYTRGSNYEVGFDVGRTFKGLIQNYLEICELLNDEYIPLYETEQGRKVYTETLESVQENYPHYVRELEGTADGAEVPFYKLFLLHMDQMMTIGSDNNRTNGTTHGCSTICCNEVDQEIMGHTEDSLADMLGYFYFVSAHVIYDKPQGRLSVTEERFTSLCYPGHLPGFTMNYNHHGFVYCINIIHARDLYSGKTPGFFLCRSLLAAENYSQAEEVLKDRGCGSAEGFSVNMTFLNAPGADRVFYNVEVGAAFPGTKESLLHTAIIRKGECSFHCNRYMRLKIPEKGGLIDESSRVREQVYDEMTPPKNKKQIINLLGHQRQDNFTVFRDWKENDVNVKEPIATLAVGIFDCIKRTWAIYTDNPVRNSPIAILPILTKSGGKDGCLKEGGGIEYSYLSD